MKKTIIPIPPRPDAYGGDQGAFNRAVFEWMNKVKLAVENSSKINDAPFDQNMVVSDYTTNTALTGTSTLADVADYLCTLIASMQRRGLVSPTPPIGA